MFEGFVDRLKSRLESTPLGERFSSEDLAHRYHQLQLLQLRTERLASKVPGRKRLRVAATACWGFPIYSQTFVYQELVQLIRNGFDLRFLYWQLNGRDQLPGQFSALWPAKRKLVAHPGVYERDYQYFQKKAPKKVESLIHGVCRASGLSRQELQRHHHFKQAFSFARMVEAYQPDYLHSYFFYEGALFMLVASHLLDIPRGVSCYADHLLPDYVLKMVPLHLQQCSIVIATSARIKRELMGLAPDVPPEKIVVKPNAIDARRFPVTGRHDPAPGTPFRLVSVCRIEPKKGILYQVEAMRLLLRRDVDVHWHVLGGVDANPEMEKYAEEVRSRIRELGLTEVVHLEGRKSEQEIRRFLEESQVFVAPFIETDTGDKDGIPTALLEAMASGIPTVATNAGSICEVIGDGEDGVIVAQRDPVSLAHAIERLLRDPARRSGLGSAAAKKIRQQFDVSVCEKRFHERIRSLVLERKDASGACALPEFDDRIEKFAHADIPEWDGTVRPSDWALRNAGGCTAGIQFPASEPGVVRIDIAETGNLVSYDIQLNAMNVELKSDRTYALEFHARADRPRKICVGVSQAHDPWQGLGFYEEIELAPEWRGFRRKFVASSADGQARIHFDLGAQPISVDISQVSLR